VILPPAIEAGHNAETDRVCAHAEDNWNGRGRRFLPPRWRGTEGHDHSHLTPNQIGRHHREPLVNILGGARIDDDILTLDVSGFPETLRKYGGSARRGVSLTTTEYVFNGDSLVSTTDQQTASGAATGTAQTRHIHIRRESLNVYPGRHHS
jgi:hypothetical protein